MPPRRVLMIAHHFPPTGGSGANRALAFARYLPEHGWQPIVLTPGEGWASNRDTDLQAQIPAGLRVIRTRSLEPRPSRSEPAFTRSFLALESTPLQGRGGAASSSLGTPEGLPLPARGEGRGEGYLRAEKSIRSNIGHLKRFPDAHLGWLPFALAAARRVDYDVAYTSSGPFTSHVVGLLLKRLSRRPWVVELRDGWYRWNRAIFPDYPRWRDTLERRLEAAALKNADRVVLVTDRMANAFRGQYDRSLPAEHFAVVPNGFDRAQFPELAPGPPGDGFGVLHAGALYYGRSLSAVLEAARRLVSTVPAFARKFSLTLLGTLDPGARAELERSGLADRIRYRGQLEHEI